MEREVKVGEFFLSLFITVTGKSFSKEEGIHNAKALYLIDSNDIKNWEKPIDKKTAARFTHEMMKKILKEEDKPEWESALQLKDLYDCHLCVNHIAQMYAKGIMTDDGRGLFNAKALLNRKQAEEIIDKAVHREKRTPPQKEAARHDQKISRKQAIAILTADEKAMVIDVRTKDCYEKEHFPYSENIPMMEIIKNPYIVNADRQTRMILYCDKGYQSAIAAAVLEESGYQNIYVMDYEST